MTSGLDELGRWRHSTLTRLDLLSSRSLEGRRDPWTASQESKRDSLCRIAFVRAISLWGATISIHCRVPQHPVRYPSTRSMFMTITLTAISSFGLVRKDLRATSKPRCTARLWTTSCTSGRSGAGVARLRIRSAGTGLWRSSPDLYDLMPVFTFKTSV